MFIVEKKVICLEKDFLSDISSVVSPSLTKRLDWVGRMGDTFTSSYRLYNAGEMCIQTPPFAVVSSIATFVYPYRPSERYITSVNFCDSLDKVKEYIEDKIINAPVSHSAQVDLFAYNGKSFERVPYSVGYYKKTTSEVHFSCDLEDVKEVFDFESTVKRKLIEEPIVDELFDTKKKMFIDIHDYWEVYYGNKSGYNTNHESEILNFKNLETVLEEAAVMMLEHEDITQVTVENSWYEVLLTVENKEDVIKDAEDWCEALDALKKVIKAKITLNY